MNPLEQLKDESFEDYFRRIQDLRSTLIVLYPQLKAKALKLNEVAKTEAKLAELKKDV